jgi:hypothetical protein
MEGMEPPSGMIMRWFDTLSNFNFLIEHRPGKKHANADALSGALMLRTLIRMMNRMR